MQKNFSIIEERLLKAMPKEKAHAATPGRILPMATPSKVEEILVGFEVHGYVEENHGKWHLTEKGLSLLS